MSMVRSCRVFFSPSSCTLVYLVLSLKMHMQISVMDYFLSLVVFADTCLTNFPILSYCESE